MTFVNTDFEETTVIFWPHSETYTWKQNAQGGSLWKNNTEASIQQMDQK